MVMYGLGNIPASTLLLSEDFMTSLNRLQREHIGSLVVLPYNALYFQVLSDEFFLFLSLIVLFTSIHVCHVLYICNVY